MKSVNGCGTVFDLKLHDEINLSIVVF